MSPAKRYAKKHAKARHRRRLQAQERLARDRRQAQQVAQALQQLATLGNQGLSEAFTMPQCSAALRYDRSAVLSSKRTR